MKNLERRAKAAAALRQAALELFVEQGYTETSLKDIATKAGYTPGNIYHYYPTKRELAIDLAEHLYGTLSDQEFLLVVAQHEVTKDRIYHLVPAFLEWAAKNRHAAMFLFGFFDLRKLTEDNTLPHFRNVPRFVIERVIREGQARGEVREGDPMRLYLVFTSVVMLVRRFLVGRLTKEEFLDHANDLSEMIWRAVRAD